MTVRTRIALGTLCVFNAFTLGALGAVTWIYGDGRAALVGGSFFWLSAGGLISLARWLRRDIDW